MDFFWALMTEKWVMRISSLLCIVLAIILFAYAFSKEGRDERGRGIIGTSALIGLATYLIMGNFFVFYAYDMAETALIMANTLQFECVIIFLVIDISIFIMRKIR